MTIDKPFCETRQRNCPATQGNWCTQCPKWVSEGYRCGGCGNDIHPGAPCEEVTDPKAIKKWKAMTTTENQNPQAFPNFHQSTMNGHPIPEMEGMSLRDYFAAKAMQGRMAADWPWSQIGFKPIDGLTPFENEAVLAYRMADAMLEARRTPTGAQHDN